MANYFVLKHAKHDGWVAKRRGASRASGVYKTQRAAEMAAKAFCARSGGGEVRIKDRNGKIRDSDTVPPGNDPFPPRDTKF